MVPAHIVYCVSCNLRSDTCLLSYYSRCATTRLLCHSSQWPPSTIQQYAFIALRKCIWRYTIVSSFKTAAVVDWPPPAYIALKIYLLDFYNFQFQYYCNWIVVDRTHHLHPKSLNSSATDLSPKQSWHQSPLWSKTADMRTRKEMNGKETLVSNATWSKSWV